MLHCPLEIGAIGLCGVSARRKKAGLARRKRAARAAEREGVMAYKDILVFLDPTAEAVERVRSAIVVG